MSAGPAGFQKALFCCVIRIRSIPATHEKPIRQRPRPFNLAFKDKRNRLFLFAAIRGFPLVSSEMAGIRRSEDSASCRASKLTILVTGRFAPGAATHRSLFERASAKGFIETMLDAT
jgi:hypothetical protein